MGPHTKLRSLPDAIAAFVQGGMHINFASTPSRSNAAIRELARSFRGRDPKFCFSATGFHSTAHLLGLLRLGRRYIGCFFGDNYPNPKPNRLYQTLLDEGVELEHWSLWTYVSALRAAAFGLPYAITNSLSGSSLGDALARAGRFLEVPDPRQPGESIGLVTPIVPDIVFVHAAAADPSGNLVLAPPHGEGFYGALAARVGVIATVERVLEPGQLAAVPHLLPLPAHRVLAVCEEPFGAHPQPLHFAPRELDLPSYADDCEHYERWRRLATDPAEFEAFSRQVLDAPDGARAYRELVGPSRLERLRSASRLPQTPTTAQRATSNAEPRAATSSLASLEPQERTLVLAARVIARRIVVEKHRAILAGIGQAFAAARLAKLLLGDAGEEVELMVETGFTGFDPWDAHPFLLSQRNLALSARLTSVDSVLGTLTCGGRNACIGVIGAAEVDESGNVNSTYSKGTLLVGSGGANDITSSARETVVLTRLGAERLVPRVEYVTSPGRRVRAVVTEECVLERRTAGELWTLGDVARGDVSRAALERGCPWRFMDAPEDAAATPLTALELEFVLHWRSVAPDASRSASR